MKIRSLVCFLFICDFLKLRIATKAWVVFLASALLLAAMRPATAVIINVDIVGEDDTVRQSVSNFDPIDSAAQVGVGGRNSAAGLAGILFFELPLLLATPVIQSAELSVELTGARNFSTVNQVPTFFNVDLYSLGTRPLDQINEPGDYGDGGGVPASATLVTDNYWVAGDNSQIGISKTADVTAAVSAAYAAGVPTDTFLALALYADIPLFSNNFSTYIFLADPDPIAGDTIDPLLSITATEAMVSPVPEPWSVILFGSGLVMLCFRRLQASC